MTDALVEREPALHRKTDGWLFIASDGSSRFLDRTWYEGARISFALCHVRGWLAYQVTMWLPLGDNRNGFVWRCLPYAGDWAYKDCYGRLSSLARFIDCDLKDPAALSRATLCEEKEVGASAATPEAAT